LLYACKAKTLKFETPIIGISEPKHNPLIKLIPILKPVYEPGPLGVSNFNVLALQAYNNKSPFVTLINANKGRFYYAKFENESENFVEKGIIESEKINQYSNEETGIVLDCYRKFDKKTAPWINYGWITHGRFNASYLCKAAEKKFNKQGADDLNDLEPMYLQAFAGVL